MEIDRASNFLQNKQ